MIKVLSVASECVPLVKTGGLADVAGALPAALAQHGVEVATLVPGYPAVMAAQGGGPVLREFPDLFGGPARLLRGALGDETLLVLDAPHLYDRPGAIYLGPDGNDWPDNPQRFAALSWVAADIAEGGAGGFIPQVVHCHDWQAALTPLYLQDRGLSGRVGSLITIHNIAFQGLAPAEMRGALRLPDWGFHPDGYEYYGKISALKAGLVYADKISTVSPTYAVELLTPDYGTGLDGVLRDRAGDLVGILNGIDEQIWAPPYKDLRGKPKHKAALRKEFDLPPSDGPLCIVISRLTGQKGLDLLLEALPTLLDCGGQLALLGSGEARLEAAYLQAARDHEGVSAHIGYDEALSRRMMAGADAILVPSRFEPCGLTQLYGLRFGTLPLVALTGGLADTVIPASAAGLAAGVATGFQFHPVSTPALERALAQMCATFADRKLWAKLQRNAMRHPVGWDRSAAHYAALMQDLARS
ncbi:glycogen synthase GlgA [Poseidonocella sedimentorum]|uniref:Glycogen synthase n=1 Tax=Poseidonocella sedimentorum TaxID=871652 RepID=A0A1I6DDV9_9RHOB|nr:glycogen synthase GlgA [Poseidonocella sedimentorum]SFR03639.1 starch synthase [Poseidonocella sedimentorum]